MKRRCVRATLGAFVVEVSHIIPFQSQGSDISLRQRRGWEQANPFVSTEAA
jgi:hypothetical protein